MNPFSLTNPPTRPLMGATAAGTFARPAWKGARDGQVGATELAALNPSLLQDLARYSQELEPRQNLDLLVVLAAAVRHSRPLRILVASHPRQVPLALTVFPSSQLAHCSVPPREFLAQPGTGWKVQRVEPGRHPQAAATALSWMKLVQGSDAAVNLTAWPATGRGLGYAHMEPEGGGGAGGAAHDATHYMALGELSWQVALFGPRSNLLPEIAGEAAYRIPPGSSLRGLPLPAPLAKAVMRLRQASTNVLDIAAWPGVGEQGAQRLLNALYLQTALVVSRSHPAASQRGWAQAVEMA